MLLGTALLELLLELKLRLERVDAGLELGENGGEGDAGRGVELTGKDDELDDDGGEAVDPVRLLFGDPCEAQLLGERFSTAVLLEGCKSQGWGGACCGIRGTAEDEEELNKLEVLENTGDGEEGKGPGVFCGALLLVEPPSDEGERDLFRVVGCIFFKPYYVLSILGYRRVEVSAMLCTSYSTENK